MRQRMPPHGARSTKRASSSLPVSTSLVSGIRSGDSPGTTAARRGGADAVTNRYGTLECGPLLAKGPGRVKGETLRNAAQVVFPDRRGAPAVSGRTDGRISPCAPGTEPYNSAFSVTGAVAPRAPGRPVPEPVEGRLSVPRGSREKAGQSKRSKSDRRRPIVKSSRFVAGRPAERRRPPPGGYPGNKEPSRREERSLRRCSSKPLLVRQSCPAVPPARQTHDPARAPQSPPPNKAIRTVKRLPGAIRGAAQCSRRPRGAARRMENNDNVLGFP
jgi:hypothetical protein